MSRKTRRGPTASPGGVFAKHETGVSPHASASAVPAVIPDKPLLATRAPAVVGGVTDRAGEITDRERAAIDQARGAVADRDPLPMITQAEGGGRAAPYADLDAHHLRMLDTFGTNSPFFLSRRVHELENMLTMTGEENSTELAALNSGLAVVASVAPENELEALLAVQMAGTHALGCEMMGRAMRNADIDRASTYVNLATKLQRTFTTQLEALARMRGKGQQTVRVEHVTVESGAQAIVGDVHHHAPSQTPTAVPKEITHAAAPGVGARAALPSPDPLGNGVPIGSDAERPVSHARRRQHGRTAR